MGISVFATPSGMIGDVVPMKFYGAARRMFGPPSLAGTLARGRRMSCPCRRYAVPMVCIGTMLGFTHDPLASEVGRDNTVLHFVSTSSGGKTTSTRCGATVWGLGATTEVEGTFLKSWKTTANASDSLLAGHNHIGLALDELKTVDAKAAGTFAYDFASGRSSFA